MVMIMCCRPLVKSCMREAHERILLCLQWTVGCRVAHTVVAGGFLDSLVVVMPFSCRFKLIVPRFYSKLPGYKKHKKQGEEQRQQILQFSKVTNEYLQIRHTGFRAPAQWLLSAQIRLFACDAARSARCWCDGWRVVTSYNERASSR